MKLSKCAIQVLAVMIILPAAGKAAAQDLPEREAGRAVFEDKCAPCHAEAPARPGTQALAIKYRDLNVQAALEKRDDLTPAYIKAVVRNGVFSMAPLRPTEVTDAELEAVAAWLSEGSAD